MLDIPYQNDTAKPQPKRLRCMDIVQELNYRSYQIITVLTPKNGTLSQDLNLGIYADIYDCKNFLNFALLLKLPRTKLAVHTCAHYICC